MKIPAPNDYLGKKIRVYTTDGERVTGNFLGYNYDYDDSNKVFLEFDVETDDGLCFDFTEDEVDHIEVVTKDSI